MRTRKYRSLSAWTVAGLALCPAGFETALAAMGAPAIMERIHPADRGRITMDEARDAAGRTYDTIAAAHDGRVTMRELGGRVGPDDLEAAQIGDGDPGDAVSKADYLALASRFFAEANVSRQKDVSPADGTLSVDELGSAAGEKLVRLIQ